MAGPAPAEASGSSAAPPKPARMPRWLAAALPWLLAASVILGAAWVRMYRLAEAELGAAEAALAAGDRAEATERAQFAMRAYTPGAQAPRAGAGILLRLAEEAEARGDRAGALAALRRLRGAIRSTRWIYSPFHHLAAPVDLRLAALTADEQLALGDADTIRGRDRSQLEADHRALLALDPVPSPGRSLWIVFSFFGWVIGAVLVIARGLDRRVRIRHRPFFLWGGFALLALVSWFVSLGTS
jgi:tetratricopeptide (TPR) repeat protein